MGYKTASFLKKYDIILFDMDGVITSEQRYWDASALTLYQLFNKDIDVNFAMKNVARIRSEIFYNDNTISLLKDRGVNSNWDLTYIVYAAALMQTDELDYSKVYEYINSTTYNALELYEFFGNNGTVGKRGGKLYEYAVQLFQEWYLGDELFTKMFNKKPTISGKVGLLNGEIPILNIDETKIILETLFNDNKILGIGTGRVKYEIIGPLTNWNILEYFDKDRLITYSHIENAEENIPNVTLTKPHSYMFLKGMLGEQYDDETIITGNYDKTNIRKTLVIGDAGADMFSAQAAGIDFAAVLTGVSGTKARDFFKINNADYILDSIADLIEKV